MAGTEETDIHLRVEDFTGFKPRFKKLRKRALLAYLVRPVLDAAHGHESVRFSNSGLAVSWARVLNELGYKLDIIDWQDDGFSPRGPYDLMVFHGGRVFNKLQPTIDAHAKLIYFATGSYWRFNNEAEDERLRDFARRHKVKAPRDRYVHDSEEEVNRAADGIVALGDPSMVNTFPKGLRVLTINNASYPDDHFNGVSKDYDKAKNNWLFFAGSGNIHKGLDLLIDAFKGLDQNLYIVTVPDKKVMAVFKKELKLPNIHLVGEVNMRTKEFYEVMDRCAFTILPSCSEGQAGSVVEAMNQGLIPVVSKETRLDTGDFGQTLKNNSIECIRQTVSGLAGLDAKKVEKLARRTRAAAIKDHNPEKFRKDLKAAVQKYLTS